MPGLWVSRCLLLGNLSWPRSAKDLVAGSGVPTPQCCPQGWAPPVGVQGDSPFSGVTNLGVTCLEYVVPMGAKGARAGWE